MVANISKFTKRILPIAVLSTAQIFAQTTNINLQSQSRNPDFSTFPFTRPVTVGTSLPAACQVGQLYFDSAAPAGANLYACTAPDIWSVESGAATTSLAWSALTNAAANLSLSMGSNTTQFLFGSATGSSDLFEWLDSAGNTGTGILGHFTTASGSSAIPWQADANGIGWQVTAAGQLRGFGFTTAGMISLPQGAAPGTFVSNSATVYAPSSIATAYQWVLPASDAAGALVSDGNGTPGHLSIVGLAGAGNILRTGSAFTIGAGGVTGNTLCKTDTNFNIVALTTSDTAAYGICPVTAASGTTNYAVAKYGQQQVLTDGAAVIGHLAVISTSNAGYVHDSGQTTRSALPATQQVIGVFATSATGSGQNVTLDLTPGATGTAAAGNKASFTGGSGGTVAASTTKYGPVSGMTTNSTENVMQQPNPATGTLTQLTVCLSSAQPSTGGITITVRKNSSATALALLLPASTAAGCYVDPVDSVASSQGDMLSIQVTNNATSASGNLSWSFLEQ